MGRLLGVARLCLIQIYRAATTPTHTPANSGMRTERIRIFPVAPWQTIWNPLGNLPRKFIQADSEGRGGGSSLLGLLW